MGQERRCWSRLAMSAIPSIATIEADMPHFAFGMNSGLVVVLVIPSLVTHRLVAEERDRLNELIRKGKRSAQLLTKVRILLKADERRPQEAAPRGGISALRR